MAPISIQIQDDDKQPIPVELPSDCSFNDFTAKLKDIFGDSFWMYSFYCHGKSFDGNKEEDFKQMKALLIPGTTLFTFVRKRGSYGMNFVDITQAKNIRKIKFSETAPDWRMAMPGLCLEGLCSNAKCEAYEELVVVNVGIRKFDLILEQNKFSKCPRCQEFVQPVTCAFNRCRWKYSGMIARGNQMPMVVNSQWINVEKDYHRFDEKEGENVSWLQLIFEVEALEQLNRI